DPGEGLAQGPVLDVEGVGAGADLAEAGNALDVRAGGAGEHAVIEEAACDRGGERLLDIDQEAVALGGLQGGGAALGQRIDGRIGEAAPISAGELGVGGGEGVRGGRY